MGNVIQGINQDGSNSGTFIGNYHNIGSTTTNFTGANVNFTSIIFFSTYFKITRRHSKPSSN